MFELDKVQSALKEFGFDGWLLYDFRGSNKLARRILNFSSAPLVTRRLYYMVPAEGAPTKLVHRIEPGVLDHLPGNKRVYLRWQQLDEEVAGLVRGMKRVAMEYSPRNAIPYVSKVDAGTVEVLWGAGVEVCSSADLIQYFEATLSEEQILSHLAAEKITTAAFSMCWKMIAEGVRGGKPCTETQIQQAILNHFDKHDLVPEYPPIVAAGPHSGDPHFEPTPDTDSPIEDGDFVLIDLWAKLSTPRAIFSDITRVGYVGRTVPAKYTQIFDVVAAARAAAINLVRTRFAEGKPLRGWEVDDAARSVVERSGYGEYFVHRTGHSIGVEIHGSGANMDNLETHDDRLVLPNTLFSIEPGIYMKDFGVHLEVNVYVDRAGVVHITGGIQEAVVPILE